MEFARAVFIESIEELRSIETQGVLSHSLKKYSLSLDDQTILIPLNLVRQAI